jgi:hypothetical protein
VPHAWTRRPAAAAQGRPGALDARSTVPGAEDSPAGRHSPRLAIDTAAFVDGRQRLERRAPSVITGIAFKPVK